MKLTFRLKGGEGSGHFDHVGIPNHQGGSLPEGESGGKSEEPKKKKRWTSKHNWSEFDSRGPNKVYQSVGENTTDSEPNARGSHKTTCPSTDNLEGYKDHRHDQSILTNLLIKHKQSTFESSDFYDIVDYSPQPEPKFEF